MWTWVRQSIAVRIVLAIVLLYLAYELSRQFVVITDDAYVTTDMSAMAADVSGILDALHVAQNQQVRAGAPLFTLRQEPYRIAVAERQAGLDVAQAQLDAANKAVAAAQDRVAGAEAMAKDAAERLGRIRTLAGRGGAARQQLDDASRDDGTARAALEQAQAQVLLAQQQVAVRQAELRLAQSALDRARYDLDQTVVHAPFDGVVAPFTAQPGDYLPAGRPVMAVLSDAGWRIVANLKEADLQGLWPGSPVNYTLSTAPWTLRPGTIRSIGRGVARQPGEPGVLPYVAPTTDWVTLPRRFPVEIDIGDAAASQRLFMGADARVLVFY